MNYTFLKLRGHFPCICDVVRQGATLELGDDTESDRESSSDFEDDFKRGGGVSSPCTHSGLVNFADAVLVMSVTRSRGQYAISTRM